MASINLAVPFYSQRDNSFIWKYKHEETKEDAETGEILELKGAFFLLFEKFFPLTGNYSFFPLK